MIKRPSRQLISSSLRSNLPLCVNTFDYNASTTDPSVPLPSSVNITINAPAKISYPALGTSGFTASSNSYGVTTLSPELPFNVTNPRRIQFKGIGEKKWYSSGTANNPRKEGSFVTSISVKRASDSDSATFDTPTSGFPEKQLCDKLLDSGFYLRSNSPYLFGVYGRIKPGYGQEPTTRVLAFVYSPLKLLPQVLNLQGLVFYNFPSEYIHASETSPSGEAQRGGIMFEVDEGSFELTCITSPIVIDTDTQTDEVFSTFNRLRSSTDPINGYSVVLGVTSLAFTL